jgi:hypothetical protein
MVKMGRAIDADSPPDAYHELRNAARWEPQIVGPP